MKKPFLYNLPSIGNLYIKTIYKEDAYGPIDFICVSKVKVEYFLHRAEEKENPAWLIIEPTCISVRDFKKNQTSFEQACERARYAEIIWFDGGGFHEKEIHDSASNPSVDPFLFDTSPWW